MINCLHHFEILTNSSKNLLNYFINGFKFKLVLAKNTDKYEHYLISSNSINFLITSLSQQPNSITNVDNRSSQSFYHTSLLNIEQSDKNLYDLVLDKKNTVFNAAFQVRDLDKILLNCKNHNVKIIKDKHELVDNDHGSVQCAIIKSCVDGVTHSLFDLKNYTGKFLPGYELFPQLHKSSLPSMTFATHFDHLTYATHKNTSKNLIEWYKNIFNMKHFRINRENDENGGLNVRTGSSGMNIKAIKYWLCAETGVEFDKSHKTNSLEPLESKSFKFVISEPLEDENSDAVPKNSNKNQISIFLEEHNGPGIQHIGLHTPNIFESVRTSKENCNQIKYYVTPETYYQSVCYY
jgi:4-hydroxyphenylpyruvate dioxygenase-like protein